MKTNDPIKQYWDNENTESMYDKNLLELEIDAVLEHLEPIDKIIDIGCGEGEGTVRYYEKVKEIVALDFSATRLKKLKSRNSNISTIKTDMRNICSEKLGTDYDKVITQRSLINLENFDEQKNAIKNIHSLLKNNGKYIMLEGFIDGVENINKIRTDFNLPSINIKWHNCFFQRDKLLEFINGYFELEYKRDFSIYFFMTRVFNAILKYPEIPRWDDTINNLAARIDKKYKSSFINNLSRLELWILKKKV
jgi:SAM-dependent methyltransferase